MKNKTKRKLLATFILGLTICSSTALKAYATSDGSYVSGDYSVSGTANTAWTSCSVPLRAIQAEACFASAPYANKSSAIRNTYISITAYNQAFFSAYSNHYYDYNGYWQSFSMRH